MKRAKTAKTAKVLSAALALVLLCGCQRVGTDEISGILKDTMTNTNEDTGEVAVPQSKKVSLDYVVLLPKSGTHITVQASVDTAVPSKVGVYVTSAFQKDDETAKNIATHIFDNSDYEILKPMLACNDEERSLRMQMIRSELEKDLQATGYKENNYVTLVRNGLVSLIMDTTTPPGKDINEFVVTGTPENKFYYDVTPEWKECMAVGKIGGEEWMLFDQCCNELNDYSALPIQLMPMYGTELNSIIIDDSDPKEDPDYSSKEQIASDFVERLGVKGYEVVSCKRIRSSNDTNNEGVGTCFDFGPILGDLSQKYMCNSLTEKNGHFAYQKIIRVFVNNGKVRYVEIYGMEGIEEVESEDAQIIDFEKADEAFSQQAPDYFPAESVWQNMDVKDIEFGYICVEDETGRNRFIPAWIYYRTDNNKMTYRKAVMAVSALDGELIRFGFNEINTGWALR